MTGIEMKFTDKFPLEAIMVETWECQICHRPITIEKPFEGEADRRNVI